MNLQISDPNETKWKYRFDEFVEFCTRLDWSPNDEEFHNALARLLLEYTDSDVVGIRVFTVTECKLLGSATRDKQDEEKLGAFESIPITAGRMPYMIETLQPIIMDFEAPNELDITVEKGLVAGFRTGISLPMIKDGKLIGDIDIASKKQFRLNEDELHYLMAFASAITNIAELSSMSNRLIEARVLDERKHLSAEIHDNLSHLVNAVRLEAEQAVESYLKGDDESLEHELKLLEQASSMAITALRDEMLSLRDVPESTSSLVMELTQLLARFERMWGIKSYLQVTGTDDEIFVSSRVLLQVMRVIHEALANVYRHAKANSVHLEVERVSGVLTIRLIDDGIGFKVEDVPPAKLGLRVMRERIETIGGEFAVESQPDNGTAVLIMLPKEM